MQVNTILSGLNELICSLFIKLNVVSNNLSRKILPEICFCLIGNYLKIIIAKNLSNVVQLGS